MNLGYKGLLMSEFNYRSQDLVHGSTWPRHGSSSRFLVCADLSNNASVAPAREHFVINVNLFFDHTERQNDFPVKLVENLREAGVNRRKAANKPFVAGEMFEIRARAGVIAIRQQEKKNGQRAKDDLQGAVQAERAEEHDGGEQSPQGEIGRHGGFSAGAAQFNFGKTISVTSDSQKKP